MDNWVFYGQTTVGGSSFDVHLAKMIKTKITRHVKIRSDANPYDPDYDEYFIERHRKKVKQKEGVQNSVSRI
jgi:RNA-directed DNA polymerase